MTSLETTSTAQQKPELRDLISDVQNPDDFNVRQIQVDSRKNQEHLTTRQEPQLRHLISYVHTTEWYRLGLQLDLDDFNLRQIGKQNQEHLTLMFQTWLKVCRNPSWQDVVQALEAIGERRLAAKLEQKFCK